MRVNEEIKEQLKFLGLRHLLENWNVILNDAKRRSPSYHRFLSDLIKAEYVEKKEKTIKSRIKRANIEDPLLMETFPFKKQPNLKKKFVFEFFDSMEYMTQPQDLIFVGPTGCGKTGLASSYLIHAIKNGYRGYFIDFKDLLNELYKAIADHSEKKIIKKFQSFDCLVIDELGYSQIKKEQAGLFFDLMKRRHKKKTTLITTQLGYDEWGDFLQNKHLTAALIDRMTENCTVFNMKKCISIRPKNIKHATNN